MTPPFQGKSVDKDDQNWWCAGPLMDDPGKPLKLSSQPPSALQDLKAVFLTVDWEINDQSMSGLIDESERLATVYGKDKILGTFFKLLISIAKYIKINKANAHKDAVNLLNSVHECLQKVFSCKGMSFNQKQLLLVGEIEKFKRLKAKISHGRGRLPSGRHMGSGKIRTSANSDQQSQIESLDRSLSELKKRTGMEIKFLRKEITVLRSELIKIRKAIYLMPAKDFKRTDQERK